MSYTLTVLDTAAIQQYIFNSNELRENIGASHLVHLATTQWVQEVLDSLKITHNYWVIQNERQPYKDKVGFRIEKMGATACAEILYAGGGNTYILFGGDNHHKMAKEFVYSLSLRIIKEAPGLNIYAAHVPYEKWGDNLPEAIETAVNQLAQFKNTLPVYQPLLGFSVTADCVSTGLPANGRHPDPDKNGQGNDENRPTLANRANRQVMAQWHASNEAMKRLRGLFPFVEADMWTNDLDKIGKLDERDESYIAVVHADGNGMGKRMLALSDFFKDIYPTQTRAYISAIRELSLAYQNTAQSALRQTVCDLAYSLKQHETDGDKKRYFFVDEESGETWFPFRPIVFGGDDVTFVCASPWGVPLAKQYLTYLEAKTLPSSTELLAYADLEEAQKTEIENELNDKLNLSKVPYACAGVSIVKTHYPISRAYTNSNELADSAKTHVLLYEPGKQASAIDWHITTTGLSGNLVETRRREYEASSQNLVASNVEGQTQMDQLTMRPLMLNRDYSWRSWDNFISIYNEFSEYWFGSHNKVMALREALRGGPDAAAKFKKTLRGRPLPLIPYNLEEIYAKTAKENGWVRPFSRDDIATLKTLSKKERDQSLAEMRCAYFDAIEMEGQLLTLFPCPEFEPELEKEAA